VQRGKCPCKLKDPGQQGTEKMTEKKREKWKNNNCTNKAEVGVCFREKVLKRGTVCHSPTFLFSRSLSKH